MDTTPVEITQSDLEAPAVFSADRVYRYVLRRTVGLNPGRCLFIMLNPSTADESLNDPTVTRCINFARSWGYGILEVANIFALRSTDPRVLYTAPSPVGKLNDLWIMTLALQADRVVAGWGNHGAFQGRGAQVLAYLRDAGVKVKALAHTQHGEPGHPLYILHDAELVEARI